MAFLLPPDHGLDLRAAVSLLHVSEGSVPLASLDIRPFERQPPAALAAGLRRLLERSATAAEAPGGAGSRGVSSAGVQLSSGLQLCRLAEHADRFELELAVDQGLGSSLGTKQGLALTFPDAPPGGGIGYRLEVRGPAGGCCCCNAAAGRSACMHAETGSLGAHVFHQCSLPATPRRSRWRSRRGCTRGSPCHGRWRAPPPLSVCTAGKPGGGC